MAKRLDADSVRSFILRHVDAHPADIVTVTAKHFEVSRQSIHMHVKALIDAKLIKATGKTRARRYHLRPIYSAGVEFPLDGTLAEDRVWPQFEAGMPKLTENVRQIASHAVSEMVNNAIDHSESSAVFVKCIVLPTVIRIVIADSGIGIFRKIASALSLDDEREAILELAKGKFTTDPNNHSGEGIFFTSRLVDLFVIKSHGLYFEHATSRASPDLLKQTRRPWDGTYVGLELSTRTERTLREVFDKYSSIDGGFSSTRVPVRLAAYGDELLVSRSQAARVLMRFEKFTEVFLDFEGVETIGQGFADQIFRVFRSEYPAIRLIAINTSASVRNMISHVVPNYQFGDDDRQAKSVHERPDYTAHGLEDEICRTSTTSNLVPPTPEIF